jgi:predicted methyltransferase
MGPQLRAACALSLVAVASACAGRPPVFPQLEDIPAEPSPAASQADESPATPERSPTDAQASTSRTPDPPAQPARIDSPSEAQPSSASESVAASSPSPPPPTESASAPEQDEPAAEPTAFDVPADVTEIVSAIDRWESDRDLDSGRHPGELLAFLGLAPGMRVAELFAGKGYTTELLARRVGPNGRVWAENPPAALKGVGRQFAERLDKAVMQNVVRVDLGAEAPLPPEARDLDAVVCVLSYHEAVRLKVDRDAMNKAVFAALKPGGEYVIVDHSAVAGHGARDAGTLHRIEQNVVSREVLRAGFEEGDSADFLRNPQDERDWNDSPAAAGAKRGTSDRFVLKFVRP